MTSSPFIARKITPDIGSRVTPIQMPSGDDFEGLETRNAPHLTRDTSVVPATAIRVPTGAYFESTPEEDLAFEIGEVQPTPREKFDAAMDMVERYAKAVHDHAKNGSGENLADVLSTHGDLFNLFWFDYGLDRE